ncbi:hypothetical protein [uncultured Capnocytophaga sp.]|uniref:hypothetical protein n=1 Tax=uncultured Capnocytophaga sp. TaxID=159273 RepID=UPI00259A3403|nr:hypothetical protein [uncultured Capnocytophaga sp.]
MPIIPKIPEIPEILEKRIIPPRGMDGSDFSDGSDRLEERLEDSEGNGDFQKKAKGVFGEKRV